MSYITIGQPGTTYGPCNPEGSCNHTDCAWMRETAEWTTCPLCASPLGYETPITKDGDGRLVHHRCYLHKIEQERKQAEVEWLRQFNIRQARMTYKETYRQARLVLRMDLYDKQREFRHTKQEQRVGRDRWWKIYISACISDCTARDECRSWFKLITSLRAIPADKNDLKKSAHTWYSETRKGIQTMTKRANAAIRESDAREWIEANTTVRRMTPPGYMTSPFDPDDPAPISL